MPGSEPFRLLIFVVAYNAQKTLRAVLDRMPEAFLTRYATEILLIDDASPDRTFEAGLSWAEDWDTCPVTVLRNPKRQSYGGNLKLGLEYGIKSRFDAVMLLHADGKYAPEFLPQMVEPLVARRAEVVIGSRFKISGDASRTGMRMHKRLGNRLMTALQNRLLGTSFSDCHSGYRGYSLGMIEKLPFRSNTDELHFDTELLIQLVRSGARFEEVSIPSYDGDELAYHRGTLYAKDAILTTLAFLVHSLGIGYHRKYDIEGGPAEYSVKLGYASSHSFAIEAVPSGSRVLDVGCGRGFVSRELLARGCYVVGIDRREPEPGSVSEYLPWKLEQSQIPARLAGYDVVLLLDIIEHLPRPEDLLAALRRSAESAGPIVILTTPNIAFLPMRVMLLLGRFNYGKEGILDLTHTRLFTFASIQSLLQQQGYEVLEVRGVPAPYPKALGDGWFSRSLLALNEFGIRLSKTLFSYQIYLRIRPQPTVDHLLRDTIRHSLERRKTWGEES
ncbi:MAG: glycosyltransferase [Myxococcales bacterium]|nr:glycosyltransferase [Myxococcales bacterium]